MWLPPNGFFSCSFLVKKYCELFAFEGLNVKRHVISEAFVLLSAYVWCSPCAHTYKPMFNDKHVSYKFMIFECWKWCKKMSKNYTKSLYDALALLSKKMSLVALRGCSIRFVGGWPSSSMIFFWFVKPKRRSTFNFGSVGLPRPDPKTSCSSDFIRPKWTLKIYRDNRLGAQSHIYWSPNNNLKHVTHFLCFFGVLFPFLVVMPPHR